MNTSRLLALSGIAVASLAIAGTLMAVGAAKPAAAAPAPAEAKTFTIDPVHSNVIFKIKHMNASNFYGRFNETSGSFTLGDTASINVTVKADSVDSNNTKRNDHIKSPDFLSAKEFPDITFSAKDLAKSGDNFKGSGELNFHGVKKTIEVTLTKTGGGPGMGGKGEVAGVESTITIKRTDFGVKGMVGPVGDDVTLIVALEGGSK
jgi:polyisoprenoid-binding protein YceI